MKKTEAVSRQPIGFQIQGRTLPAIKSQPVLVFEQIDSLNDVENLMIEIGNHYVKRRSDQGFARFAEEDLVSMFDKLFIRYFEKIV